MIQLNKSRIPEDKLGDPRLAGWEESVLANMADEHYMLQVCVHEAAHEWYAKLAGATRVTFHGPHILYDREFHRLVPEEATQAIIEEHWEAAMRDVERDLRSPLFRRQLIDHNFASRLEEADDTPSCATADLETADQHSIIEFRTRPQILYQEDLENVIAHRRVVAQAIKERNNTENYVAQMLRAGAPVEPGIYRPELRRTWRTTNGRKVCYYQLHIVKS